MSKPVIVEYTKGEMKGATYVVTSAAAAEKHHPDAKIVGYEDGTPYEAPSTKAVDKPKDGK